jgi:hypothetical protein
VGGEETPAPHILAKHYAAEAWWVATFPATLTDIIKEYAQYDLIIRDVHIHYLWKFWSETFPDNHLVHTIIHEYAGQNMFPHEPVSNFGSWMAAPRDDTPWQPHVQRFFAL